MHRFTALVVASALAAAPLAGCGEEEQTAAEFCADHGGVRPDSTEPDGDALCQDGTEYEADEGESGSSSKPKKPKKRK